MKVGVISDVHGNLHALKAVLDDMPDEVEELVCLGDVVGYGPRPGDCLELVREECDYLIQGNHEHGLDNLEKYSGREEVYAALKLAGRRLGEEEVEYLLRRPWKTGYMAGEGDLFLVHSHPRVRGKYLLPGEFHEARYLLESFDAVALGHTHVQHVERFDNGVVFNPGSVGQPWNGEEACYAVYDTESVEVSTLKTGYDVEKTVQEVREAGLPDENAEKLFSKPGNTGKHGSGTVSIKDTVVRR